MHFAFFVAHEQAIVGDDADRPALDAGIGADDGFAVFFFVLGEAGFVHDGFEHLAHVEGLGALYGEVFEQFFFGAFGGFGLDAVEACAFGLGEARHEVADGFEAVGIVFAFVVGDAGDFAGSGGAAEGLLVHDFAYGCAHEVGAGEKDGACAFHDQRFIGHDGQVGSACHATAHDGGDLRDAE